MFGLFSTRLAPALGRLAPAARTVVFSPASLSCRTVLLSSVVLGQKTRTFGSTGLVLSPAASSKKTSARTSTTATKKKSAVKKTKTTTSAKPKKKTKKAAPKKKKAAPKKKVTTKKKKVAPKKPTFKITADIKPPKRPLTPYSLFYTEKRKEMPTATSLQASVEMTRAISEQWNTLSDAEKMSYVKAHEVSRAEYLRAREEWSLKTSRATLTAINRVRKKQGKPKVHRHLPSGATKAPLAPYARFVKNYTAENTHLRGRECFASAAKAWREIPAAEKATLSEQYQAEKRALQEGSA